MKIEPSLYEAAGMVDTERQAFRGSAGWAMRHCPMLFGESCGWNGAWREKSPLLQKQCGNPKTTSAIGGAGQFKFKKKKKRFLAEGEGTFMPRYAGA